MLYFPSASPCFIDISACIFKCTNKILKYCKLRSVWRLCWTAFLGTFPARKHQFTSVDVLMYILVCAPSQFVMNNITFYSFLSYIYIHTHIFGLMTLKSYVFKFPTVGALLHCLTNYPLSSCWIYVYTHRKKTHFFQACFITVVYLLYYCEQSKLPQMFKWWKLIWWIYNCTSEKLLGAIVN